MHPLLGRPLIDWAVRAVEPLADEPPVVVVGHGKETVIDFLARRARFVDQAELLGTGHAVMQADSLLRATTDAVLVTYGDMPLLKSTTLERLVDLFAASASLPNERRPALALLTVERADPQGFGRIVRGADGAIQAIVEEVDCTPEQRNIRELNPGIYCFDASWLWENLPHVPMSAKGEYYLTDLVGMAVRQGRPVLSAAAPFEEVYGVNNRVHLAEAATVLRRRILEHHMLAGVTIVDPATTYIEDTVLIGQDSTILPGCTLQGNTMIGNNCLIGPYTLIANTTLGDRCRAVYSVLEDARMDTAAEVGPFGHLRKGAHLGEHVHMGNFGEVKDSYLGPDTKMGHFSYIGNAHIAGNVNIGAGTITCNYDGAHKHKTTIGQDAFLGSDTLLVAPVNLGAGARTGAGAVVTRDVPAHTLVYGVPARAPARTAGQPEP
jgi:bifunctional UDP-N-acetylglucosamine pyrophosphorylase/glucosamine-1-phosphate N-acetyltransferase